jgi:hypothetical protein
MNHGPGVVDDKSEGLPSSPNIYANVAKIQAYAVKWEDAWTSVNLFEEHSGRVSLSRRDVLNSGIEATSCKFS